jgi:hypothetical protein
MDDYSDSDYEIGLSGSRRSTLEEIFSIGSLIQRVEEFQRRNELETLEKLTNEKSLLQRRIAHYRKSWSRTLELLQKVQEALLSMTTALEKCSQEKKAAEKDWLAFWGIISELEKDSRQVGWV